MKSLKRLDNLTQRIELQVQRQAAKAELEAELEADWQYWMTSRETMRQAVLENGNPALLELWNLMEAGYMRGKPEPATEEHGEALMKSLPRKDADVLWDARPDRKSDQEIVRLARIAGMINDE